MKGLPQPRGDHGTATVPLKRCRGYISKAIVDYTQCFVLFQHEPYVKYFELNISCPNTKLTERFTDPTRLDELLTEFGRLNIKQPIFLKMPSDLGTSDIDALVKTALRHGIAGFILANLIKDRRGTAFDAREMAAVATLPGSFSGRPAFERSNDLISHVYCTYGRDCLIIGCGGIFSAQDAHQKIRLGATLVQMITGLVFNGPQLIGEINAGLVRLLQRDGFANIAEAIGTA